MNILGYNIVRTDTQSGFPKHGVCFYIKKSLVYLVLENSYMNTAIVFLPIYSLYIIVVYRPPSYNLLENLGLINFLTNFCDGKEVLIIGDFNLSSVKWNDPNRLTDITPSDRVFYNCFIELGLSQFVNQPTYPRSDNILDLILSTEHDRISSVSVLPQIPHCDHCPVSFCYNFDFSTSSENPVMKFTWHKGDYTKIALELSEIDWDFEFSYLNVQAKYTRFLDILLPLVNRYVPKNTAKHEFRVVKPPRDLLVRRGNVWNEYKNDRRRYGRNSAEAHASLELFNGLNYNYRNYSITSQISYEDSMTGQFLVYRKALYSYMRSKKVGRPTVGPLKMADGTVVYDKGLMAELFAESFSSVYRADLLDAPAPHQLFNGTLNNIDFSIEEVCKILRALDDSSSMGPDSVHPRVLKSCANSLAYPLYLIFKDSFYSRRVPKQWSVSNIIPIFKKGSRCNPLNYRPISITSVCCKTMERIVTNRLVEYLETNGILATEQYGFRKGRSVEDQLLLAYNDVTEWVDQGFIVDIVHFDCSKAFDVVNHSILLTKLRCIGIEDFFLDWIYAFLTERIMYVVIEGESSNPKSVKSGVPQGSVLGPILFLIYINCLARGIACRFYIFADDLKIYLRIRYLNRTDTLLDLSVAQNDINLINNTGKSWGLSMNANKCVVMRFQRGNRVDWNSLGPLSQYYLDNTPIKFVESHTDLGITIDCSLKFHLHVQTVTNKAAGLISNILRSTLCRSIKFMMSIYKTYIRPLLEFSVSVWATGYVGDMNLLESIQRRWTRNVEGLENLDYYQRLIRLDLYSVKGRLLRADLIKCYKIFHGKCAISPDEIFNIAPQAGTRGHIFKLSPRHVNLECRKRFFTERCITNWNNLPSDTVTCSSLDTFKKHLHDNCKELLFDCY